MSCVPMGVESGTSEDAVLGGRLRIRQPLRGHRVGHDAILLAAATAARPGERVVELGSGVGAAGLALAVRIPGLHISLIEIDAELCALASANATLNRLHDRTMVLKADVENTDSLAAAGLMAGGIDRVLMNPPFQDARRQNVSPDPRRRLAHVGTPELLSQWVATAAWLLKPNGVLTLIWRADGLNDVLATLEPRFGGIGVLPVEPRAGAPPIRVLVRARKAPGAGRKIYPVFTLNGADDRPTAAAEAVLREGKTLDIAQA